MPLNWDISEARDVEFIKGDDEWGVTHTIILNTVNVGLGKITEANAAEFYARIHFLEELYGDLILATRNGKRIERPIMPLDIERRIGLRTNVSDESRASFIRRHVADGVIRSALFTYGHARRAEFEGREYQWIEPTNDQPEA